MLRLKSTISIVIKIRVSILLGFFSLAQVSAQTCPCPGSFAFIREKTELNYAGFSEKVTPASRPEYEEHTRVFQQRADTVQEMKAVLIFVLIGLNGSMTDTCK
ncbi:MAG: hypothetical protein IPH31_05860 [Lewinellaceae bacterium]|nr:hypothetical protein [Lewinellaceae bacterium]